MSEPRDPVERAAEKGRDLYGIATWEPRTLLDRFAAMVYWLVLLAGRVAVVLVALLILVAQFYLSDLSAAATDPRVVALVPLSVLPALALVAYVWYADVTTSEPLSLLGATFLLGVLFAMFAAVVNGLLSQLFGAVPVVGMVLYFYLVVAPVEETVKLLAVRLYAFPSPRFDSVVDGAVYGAVAGLGFATIENYLYISRSLEAAGGEAALVGAIGGSAAVRALAGPGHVIYSAIAGYYLGLAKFNPENAGPVVVKGLLVASFVHATYNTLVGPMSGLLNQLVGFFQGPLGFVGFVLVYDGLFLLVVYRKLNGYATAYRETNAGGDDAAPGPELTEFE